MIPVRLEMKNFLPYRSPDPVRFEGIHLACLTGPNGAGKSSLLDAITWALWGKARAKRDEDLLHLGQGDMYVQLDFEQEDAVYRVLRKRARGKRGQGTLDLFIFRADETPNLITEPSMRATQHKINEILRLDYETFTHSAFLQQGRADAFTTKSPAERKKILSDILGLERWSQYEDAVKEKLKVISNNLHYFEQRIQEIDEELARKPGLEKDLAAAQTSYEEAQTTLKAAEARLKEVESAPGDLSNAQSNKSERERRLKEHQRDLQTVQTHIEGQQERINSYQEVVANREEIEQGYTALKTAREANQALSEKLMQLKTLDDERYRLRGEIDSARARLESERSSTQQRIQELEQQAEADYTADLETVQAEVNQLQTLENERNDLDGQISDLREQQATLKGALQSVTAEGQALKDRLERLQAADPEAALCPLCGQPLDAESRTNLIEQLEEDISAKREEYRLANVEIHDIGEQIDTGRKTIGKQDLELKRLPPLRERIGVLQTQAQTAQQAAERLEEERQALERLQAELEAETYAPEAREQLTVLDGKQAELGYDESAHDDISQQLQTNTQYEGLYTQLQIALETLPSLEQSLQDAQARRERLNHAISDTEGEIEALEGEIARLAVLVEEYKAREAEVEAQRTQERTAYERVVNARQALDSLDKLAERRADFELRRDDARHQDALYRDLRQAFGKNGIPAMIIETAIPELESSANNLLSRMTDGRMHLRLMTQREKVSGGTAETLDIEIADELGTRNYELYSGGEAFRINFALRVALSQMLARRAGAHLRTLFIDEGFGTQDEAGRGKLVEAINAIQNEFDLILVITHIDELRDSFPVHIVVDKTPNGSRIGVL